MLILFRWHELWQALAAERGQEDLAREQALDRFHHTVALFLHRRDVAPQPAELGGA